MGCWVCWWGDSEQRQGPLCYCGNMRDLRPLTSVLRLSTVGSVGRQITNTHLGLDGLWWMATREPQGQLSQPHTESTSWPHVGVFSWMRLSNSWSYAFMFQWAVLTGLLGPDEITGSNKINLNGWFIGLVLQVSDGYCLATSRDHFCCISIQFYLFIYLFQVYSWA